MTGAALQAWRAETDLTREDIATLVERGLDLRLSARTIGGFERGELPIFESVAGFLDRLRAFVEKTREAA